MNQTLLWKSTFVLQLFIVFIFQLPIQRLYFYYPISDTPDSMKADI